MWAALQRAGPGDRPLDRVGDLALAAGKRRAMVQAHGHVGAQGFSGSPMARSGVSSSSRPSRCDRKRHALVGDPICGRQAEHLESAGIGQNRTVPAHECVQSAQRLDHAPPGPKAR